MVVVGRQALGIDGLSGHGTSLYDLQVNTCRHMYTMHGGKHLQAGVNICIREVEPLPLSTHTHIHTYTHTFLGSFLMIQHIEQII